MNKEKALIRSLVRSRDHSGEDVSVLWRKLELMPEFIEAGTVLAYGSIEDEVPTWDFIERWHGIKRIALPLVKGDGMILKQYDPCKLKKGYRGIMEPSEDSPDIDPSEVDFAVIPGVAFDLNGGRLGRGKGFYDRFLPKLNCPTVGVSYKTQIVESVPSDPWDIPLSMVLTP